MRPNFADLQTNDARAWGSLAVAMVPNFTAPPFYSDLIFNSSGEIVDSVKQRYNTHDPYRSITTYKENLLQLNAIRIDCGDLDGNTTGNINFANKLATIGITNTFESYPGDHTNKLEERMELKVLPFFSRHLVFED